MKLARWHQLETSGDEKPVVHGFIENGLAVPFPDGLTVEELLGHGLRRTAEIHQGMFGGSSGETVQANQAGTPVDQVQLLAPLTPASIRDFVTFEEHVEGVSASIDGKGGVVEEWYAHPTFYFTNPHTVHPTATVISPPPSEKLDVELELAAVIGAPEEDTIGGSNLTAAQARAHLFGYTVMNDWSARDLQAREMKVRLGPCKGKDFAMTLGPWIVTADEVDAARDDDGFLRLSARLWINDELVGEDLISNMGWPFEELIAYASRNSLIVPGDVLGSGTVGNGGCLAELWGVRGQLDPPPLRAGDRVRMEIERVGTIVNTVGESVKGPTLAPAQRRPRARPRKEKTR